MIEDKIKKNVKMATMTTFRVGGIAKYFIEVNEKEELVEAVSWARKNKKTFFILGGGSNVIFNDGELDFLVIKLFNNKTKIINPRISLGAGVSFQTALSLSRKEGLAGLEWGFGIPRATMGGCVRGNAGAFGNDISELIETVEAFNVSKGVFVFLSKRDCKFGYRTSLFKQNKNFLIWETVLKLKKESANKINEKIENNMNFRDLKQPKLPSAGSIFKNLFLKDVRKHNKKLAELLVSNCKVRGEKVGSGTIIDMLGLKGKIMGGAKISLEHANFIVNTGTATALDIFKLMKYVKNEVKQRFNIELEPEVQFIGFEKYENS